MNKKFTLRYETKAWYEIDVAAKDEQSAINKLKYSTYGDFEKTTMNKKLEDEDLTPTDIQVVEG
ncbi:MAG TPA: hypothetical protein DCW31_03715 [Lactobacillus sp.]|nr:hypothetical protein [Lactobacillus sp.]